MIYNTKSTITKTYINAKYKDKDEVKQLGAKWDNDEKRWYVMSYHPNYNKILNKYGKMISYKEYIEEKKQQEKIQRAEQKQKKKDEKVLRENYRAKGYRASKMEAKIDKVFGKYNPEIKLLDNIKYVGHKVIRIKVDESKSKKYNIKDVVALGNKFSQYMDKKKVRGKLMTSIVYGDLGWRSGYFTNIGDDIKLYSHADSGIEMDEPQNIRSFVFYMVLKPRNAGGNDKFNDCLYNCLRQLLHNSLPWKDGASFKKFLGLNRFDKVPIDLIPKIEQKLRTFQINVRGDYVYSSTIQSSKSINLLLQNEHYTINKMRYNKPPLFKYVSYNEKKPMLYDKLTFEGYDGETKRKLSKQDVNDILYNHKTEYILIYRDEDYNKLTIEEEYVELINIIETLKTESNGIINMYKTGNYKNTALDLLDRFTKYINELDPIEQDEADWIHKASIGALIWAEEFEGQLYKYDVKSLYPHLMTLPTNKFPIKRGEFMKLTKFDEYFQFGIYRCIIKPSTDDNINKLFRFNKDNFYTQTSLTNAKSLNLEIELIIDDEPNFLYYSRDKLITCQEVFKTYVDFLFNLKEKNVPKSKKILNMLWGALGEVKTKKYYCENNKQITISKDEELFLLRPYKLNEDIDIIETSNIANRYLTPYARLTPFLISKGRQFMSDIMKPYSSKIHRIQTDGFYCETQIHTNTEVNIGELKYEGFTENGIIKNCINPVPVHY